MATAFKKMNQLTSDDVLHLCEFNTQHRRVQLIMISIHYLAAANNDCSRFCSMREQVPFSALFKLYHLLVNY